MRTVIYHPKVPAEVRSFLDHYDAISKDLGDSFWHELTEAISHAREYPERHHFDHTGRRRSNLKRHPKPDKRSPIRARSPRGVKETRTNRFSNWAPSL